MMATGLGAFKSGASGPPRCLLLPFVPVSARSKDQHDATRLGAFELRASRQPLMLLLTLRLDYLNRQRTTLRRLAVQALFLGRIAATHAKCRACLESEAPPP